MLLYKELLTEGTEQSLTLFLEFDHGGLKPLVGGIKKISQNENIDIFLLNKMNRL